MLKGCVCANAKGAQDTATQAAANKTRRKFAKETFSLPDAGRFGTRFSGSAGISILDSRILFSLHPPAFANVDPRLSEPVVGSIRLSSVWLAACWVASCRCGAAFCGTRCRERTRSTRPSSRAARAEGGGRPLPGARRWNRHGDTVGRGRNRHGLVSFEERPCRRSRSIEHVVPGGECRNCTRKCETCRWPKAPRDAGQPPKYST